MPELVEKDQETKTLYCSFCGKSQHEVKKLVAGPHVYICNESVLAALGMLVDQGLFTLDESVTDETRRVMEQQILKDFEALLTKVVTQELGVQGKFRQLAGMLVSLAEVRGEPRPVELVALMMPTR